MVCSMSAMTKSAARSTVPLLVSILATSRYCPAGNPASGTTPLRTPPPAGSCAVRGGVETTALPFWSATVMASRAESAASVYASNM